jgi:DNA/RNA-binding domain of Phe-tRNA-synthetase-like protein
MLIHIHRLNDGKLVVIDPEEVTGLFPHKDGTGTVITYRDRTLVVSESSEEIVILAKGKI